MKNPSYADLAEYTPELENCHMIMIYFRFFFLEHAGELRIFVLRRREGPITVKPCHTLDQSEAGVEKTLRGLLHIKKWTPKDQTRVEAHP